MRRFLVATTTLVFCCAAAVAQNSGQSSTREIPTQQLFKKLAPSIFVVEALDQSGVAVALGSGVALAASEIVTNCHVTKDGTTFRVSQNSRAWPARVIRADTNHDICRLKVTGLQVIPVQLRTSDHLAVGERVVALGSPQGLELTISEGIISGIRDLSGGDRLLQTTAAISHGSSGGGLFDGQGRLVGITTLYLAESQNLNFAVPAEVASATGLGGPPAKGIPDRPRDERPQPERQPSASLVVTTDLDCYWTLDGVSQPELKAGDTKTVKVSSGEHLVEANTPSGWDSWQTVVTIGRGGRELIQIPLSSVRQERQEKEQKEVAESRRAEERKREEERKRAEGRKREQQQDNERYKFVFASIPAGEFDMGCSPNDKWCVPGEWPRHPVRISRGFEIGKYEVTQAMWESVMHNNPSHFTGADRPVERVSWYDVMKFLLLLNDRHDGYYYRLPTEAEWEYAARASSRSDHYGKLDAIAWYKDNSGGQTHPVGQKQPNAWGLYDMLGNVGEWVWDFYDEEYYGESPGTDPKGPPPPRDSFSLSYRVFRGGAYVWGATYNNRVSSRYKGYESMRESWIGFRCVREPAR